MDTETAKAQDARVEALWATLDTRKQGHLDLAGLKKGLRKIDHPLKNADKILAEVMETVDTDGNGKISYHEFRTFVQETERELFELFKSIDIDRNGKLSREELRLAFRRAGLAVPNSKLDVFFSEVDTNNDGHISFEEWRDFLLFTPGISPNLHEVMSYYQATHHINPEGDVLISDDTIYGLGIHFLHSLFGSIFLVAKTPPLSASVFVDSLNPLDMAVPAEYAQTLPPRYHAGDLSASAGVEQKPLVHSVASVLIGCFPDIEYFVAGGIAGIVSRTSTAPLDRLKVYLIAQTDVAQEAVAAAKSGSVFRAALNAWRPLAGATKELWQAGGVRSLYAGNGLNVVKVMPESAIKFGAYEAAKRAFATLEGHNDPAIIHSWSKFVAGGMAGMISQFAVYPIDTLKFRMQCETVSGGLHGNRLIIATAKKMWRHGGIAAYYRGIGMGLVGIFPYAALDLGTFEYLKRTITSRNARKRGCHEEDAAPGGFMTAAIGGFSGAFGASVVYPINLLRTRLQSQGTVLHPRTYTGIVDVTRQTVKGEGMRGLFKGLTPNLLKVVPAVSITYVVYDKSKAAMGLH
ncbi:calcium dependent mitochondrial carrier protein-like protein [Bimuria novae-zelandiae CBS 107.79]|uniref:Mitochondrial thiamine pyrophosphate carrier 1 n=1 Tax=Bimuria novae-zelandiae CBS 107.79 TaxID=1447943 RepID=A0A6A5UU64_9PLEO|nr:calcium dependent mitochondrial carrier protein-like protein [Bimuria novae-zelandiae CBS 107.79]